MRCRPQKGCWELLSATALGALWLLSGAGGPVLAEPSAVEPPAKVTVVAEGNTPFLPDMSLDEARGRARDEARRNALEQAVGVFVRATSVVHNSQIADELISSVARGVIEEEQWTDERIEEVKGGKRAGTLVSVYHTRLKALIRPVRVERRGAFELRASLNKHVFQDGEEALITVRSSQPAYVHLFSVTQDGNVTLLFPNRLVAKNLLGADQDLVFPSDSQKALGIRLRVMLPPGSKRVVEHIKVIATRKPITLAKEESSGSVFRTFASREAGLIQHVVKNLALLEDEDWTETTLPYEVRQ